MIRMAKLSSTVWLLLRPESGHSIAVLRDWEVVLIARVLLAMSRRRIWFTCLYPHTKVVPRGTYANILRYCSLEGTGVRTNVDLQKIVETGDWISKELGRKNESKVGTALMARL